MKRQIEFQNVSCMAGSRYLLQDINWQVSVGEHWVLFGENGSGKTSLLSVIAGYLPYQKGVVKMDGQPYSHDMISNLRRRVGWVSTSFFDKILHRERVLDIVLAGKDGRLGINYMVQNADLKRARFLLQYFGLSGRAENGYATLSKGEQQNVLFARAFMGNPEILLLDEPSAGLDLLARERLQEDLVRIVNTKKITILYVTHYPEEITSIFTHMALLKQGRMVQQGTIAEMMTNEVMGDLLDTPVTVNFAQECYRIKKR